MINPFTEKQERSNNISYGLSSFGYDARVFNELKFLQMLTLQLLIQKLFQIKTLLLKQKMYV